ncbi:TetR/AcrR family transcriptional regulator [Mucisphaera sp.]|uniref:TetR/AcrR family transcriptional regulator n=1 Tax=Mucisphaera sp. TaxID=2913024 RepID=UPI003D108072
MVPTTNAQRSDRTRSILLTQATLLFADQGWAETSTQAVIDACNLTKGALYHHFSDKTDLFRAVFEQVNKDLLEHIIREAHQHADPTEALVAGCRAYLAAAAEPAVARIYLLDGPAVLGWARWREIDARFCLGSLREGVAAALGHSDEPLTLALSGAMNELALACAEGQVSTANAQHAIESLVRASIAALK